LSRWRLPTGGRPFSYPIEPLRSVANLDYSSADTVSKCLHCRIDIRPAKRLVDNIENDADHPAADDENRQAYYLARIIA